MKNGLLIIMIFACVIVMFCCAACLHDLRVVKAYNKSLQEQMNLIRNEQEAQSKEMRVMKQNNDIVFNLAINKEWEIEEN